MDRRTLDLAVPMVFGALVACSALWFRGALVPICVVGGMLTALYWSALRQKLPVENPPRGSATYGPGSQDAPTAPEPGDRTRDRAARDDDPPYGSA